MTPTRSRIAEVLGFAPLVAALLIAAFGWMLGTPGMWLWSMVTFSPSAAYVVFALPAHLLGRRLGLQHCDETIRLGFWVVAMMNLAWVLGLGPNGPPLFVRPW